MFKNWFNMLVVNIQTYKRLFYMSPKACNNEEVLIELWGSFDKNKK